MSQPSIHFELRGNESCRHLSILAYWTSGYEESPSRRVLEYETENRPVGRGSFPKPNAKVQQKNETHKRDLILGKKRKSLGNREERRGNILFLFPRKETE